MITNMLGTGVNMIAILAGGLLGICLKGGIKESYQVTVMQAIGLSVLLVGGRAAAASGDVMLIIFSLVIGGLLGSWWQIEQRLERLGSCLEVRFSKGDGNFAKGFVTASLLFCVGSMAIVGSLESGLSGNHQTLMAKSVLDGITSIILGSVFGPGVILSAIPVGIYQGSITLASAQLKPFLMPQIIAQMTAVGGLLIVGIGVNILEIKRIFVGNLLPAIFMPLIFQIAVLAWHLIR